MRTEFNFHLQETRQWPADDAVDTERAVHSASRPRCHTRGHTGHDCEIAI